MHERQLTSPRAITTSSLPSAPFHENIGRKTITMHARSPPGPGRRPPAQEAGYMHICMCIQCAPTNISNRNDTAASRLPPLPPAPPRHTVGARATFCPRKVATVGCIRCLGHQGLNWVTVSNVPNRSPRVAGLTHASVVTIPKMG
eukprot:scaffold89326_cov45-Phaeocystis_antarctica.AAC.1